MIQTVPVGLVKLDAALQMLRIVVVINVARPEGIVIHAVVTSFWLGNCQINFDKFLMQRIRKII